MKEIRVSNLNRSVTMVNFSDVCTTYHEVNRDGVQFASTGPSLAVKPTKSILKKSNSFSNLNKMESNGNTKAYTHNRYNNNNNNIINYNNINNNNNNINNYNNNNYNNNNNNNNNDNIKRYGHRRSYIDPVYLASTKAPVVSNEMDKKVSQSDRLKYKVAVTTGSQKNAKTTARVFITLKGCLGDLPRRHLTKKRNSNFPNFISFNPATTNTFIFEARDIGDVTSVIIEHDGVNEEDSWFLKKIKITKPLTAHKKNNSFNNSNNFNSNSNFNSNISNNSNTDYYHNSNNNNSNNNTFIFPCNNWLSLYKGDGLKKRQLYCKQSLLTTYEVVIVTGEVRGVGESRACLYLTIFGKTRKSGKLFLEKSNNDVMFADNQSDIFFVTTYSVGPIVKMKLEREQADSLNYKWFLRRAVVTDLNNTAWKYFFHCDRWLSDKYGDGMISVVLVTSSNPVDIKTLTTYYVTLFTGTKEHSSTSAQIYITLMGALGTSGERKVPGEGRPVKKGSETLFKLESMYLGSLSKIQIRHDNSGKSPDWLLEKVVVDDRTSERTYTFHCHKWLASNRGDGKISRVLNLGSKNINLISDDDDDGGGGKNNKKQDNQHQQQPPPLKDEFEIEIKTGDQMNAATSANVYIIFYPGPISNNKNNNKFNRHSNKYNKNNNNNNNYDNDDDEDDDDNKRSVKDKENQVNRVDLKGGKFNRDGLDLFTITMNRDVFPFEKVTIGHDGAGLGAGWFLEWIRVKCLRNNETQSFECHKWLARDEGDGLIERTLYSSTGNRNDRPEVTYKILVRTSDVTNAGTDANVFIQLCGSKEETESLELKKSLKNLNKFERGKVDEFALKAHYIGPIKKIKLWHDGSGLGSDWHPNCIEISIEPPHENIKLISKLNSEYGRYGSKDVDIYGSFQFVVDRWLREKDGVVEIEEGDQDLIKSVRSKEKQKVMYKILVRTSDVTNAGTDANVFIQLCGSREETESLELKKSLKNLNKFERGKVDEFALKAHYIGPIRKLKIWHDGSGMGSDWSVDDIVISVDFDGNLESGRIDKTRNDHYHHRRQSNDLETTEEQFKFKINRWIKKSDGVLVFDVLDSVDNVKNRFAYGKYDEDEDGDDCDSDDDDDDDDDYNDRYSYYKK